MVRVRFWLDPLFYTLRERLHHVTCYTTKCTCSKKGSFEFMNKDPSPNHHHWRLVQISSKFWPHSHPHCVSLLELNRQLQIELDLQIVSNQKHMYMWQSHTNSLSGLWVCPCPLPHVFLRHFCFQNYLWKVHRYNSKVFRRTYGNWFSLHHSSSLSTWIVRPCSHWLPRHSMPGGHQCEYNLWLVPIPTFGHGAWTHVQGPGLVLRHWIQHCPGITHNPLF